MADKVKLDNLKNYIMKYLEEYIEDIEEGVIEETDTITQKAVKELKETSPKRKGTREKPYHKGWTRQTGRAALKNHRYSIKIHNKTNYQLTHLLEFGHATKNGKHTKPQPHIRPLEEKYRKLYEKNIITVLRRRKK